MTFSDAVAWCRDQEASWTFRPASDGNGYVLSIATARDSIDVRGRKSTDWGWLLIEAVKLGIVSANERRNSAIREARVSVSPPGTDAAGVDAYAPTWPPGRLAAA